jgi:serine/threonine protein kinase
MAPEIIQKKEYSGAAADVWSLGIILFVLLAGCFPFNGATEKELYGKICRGGLFHMPESIPIDARRLILSMLSYDPVKRPNAKAVCNDRWLSN